MAWYHCSIRIAIFHWLAVRYGSVALCYGTLWNVTEHCGTLRKCYVVLRSITEHYRALHDVTERYGSVTELLWNATEPLQKILVMPITNW